VKRLLLVCLSILFVVCCYGQINIDKPKVLFDNEIGINMGATTGVGMSFRKWFDKNGVQLTVLPLKSDETTMISAGITVMHSFKCERSFRFFGYWGNHLFRYRGIKQDLYNALPPPWQDINFLYDESEDVDILHYNTGCGVGVSMGHRVGFNLQVGYGAFDVFGSFDLFPTGEMGLYYRF
jgi:hypothetical protein